MPFRDGTGPRGEGPKTGRGVGPCENQQPVEEDKQPASDERPRWGLRRNIKQGFGGRGGRGSFGRNGEGRRQGNR